MTLKREKIDPISLYYSMLRIRMVEEAIADRYPEQEMRCPVHLCCGQEAVAVGVCAALTKKDYVLSNHRSHGHFLAKGGSLRSMMAELYGKATGCNKGKGGSMHLVDLDVNYLGSTAIVGGTIPVAAGVAFGSKMKKEKGRVSVVFLGDATTEEGVFSESLNFASLKALPVLFVSENNLYSVYTPLSERQPKKRDNIAIASAYGLYARSGDGNNVEEVAKITASAVDHMRKGKGPAFLKFDTYRFREHCGPNFDDDLGYRPTKELESWRRRCPVKTFESLLLKNKALTRERLGEFRRRIQAEIEDAFSFAKSSPFPAVEEIYTDVYA